MSEKVNLANPELSQEKLTKYIELANKLKAVAPNNVTIQALTRSLELGYLKSARDFYLGNIDKFRQIPPEATRIIEEELLKDRKE